MKNLLMRGGLAATLCVGFYCQTFAAGNGIYQINADNEASIELSNVPTQEDSNLVVEASAENSGEPAGNAASAGRSNGATVGSGKVTAVEDSGQLLQDAGRLLGSGVGDGRMAKDAIQDSSKTTVAGDTPWRQVAGESQPARPATVDTSIAGGRADTSTVAGVSPSAPTPTAHSTPAAASVLDSPELLNARLLQYRDHMLNEPLQANGLPTNPAVVRRYRMVNRSTFQAGN